MSSHQYLLVMVLVLILGVFCIFQSISRTSDHLLSSKRIALLFGYGQYPNGELLPQTRSRCEKAGDLYKDKKVDEICIACFVMSADQISMGAKMKECLMENGIPETAIRMSLKGKNTAGEIDTFLKMIPRDSKIYGVSSLYHLPRIWFLFATRKVSATLIGTMEHTNTSDIIFEPLKFVNALLRPFSWSKTVESEKRWQK